MKITWSDQAVRAARERFGSEAGTWRLVYDTEGCGCAVNGVPALWAVDRPAAGDVRADGAEAVWHDPRQEIFFEPQLRIGYAAERRSFTLSSDNQIYTNHLALADRRSGAAARS